MRIPKTEVAKREAYVLGMFAKSPAEGGWGLNMSIPQVSEALKKSHGSSMNLARLYELREEARKAAKSTPTTTL